MQILTTWMAPGQADAVMFLVLLTLIGCALATFIALQLWLANPRRKEYNKIWFAKFESHVREIYRNKGMGWRMEDLHNHFDQSFLRN